jgi:hypothetical protein
MTRTRLIHAQDAAICLTFRRDHVSRHTEAAGFQDQACDEEVSLPSSQFLERANDNSGRSPRRCLRRRAPRTSNPPRAPPCSPTFPRSQPRWRSRHGLRAHRPFLAHMIYRFTMREARRSISAIIPSHEFTQLGSALGI